LRTGDVRFPRARRRQAVAADSTVGDGSAVDHTEPVTELPTGIRQLGRFAARNAITAVTACGSKTPADTWRTCASTCWYVGQRIIEELRLHGYAVAIH
jgi:hypothetical protein